MIEIRNKATHAVMLRAAVDTLNGKNLTGLNLAQADLSGTSMTYACFCKAILRLADLHGALLANAMLDAANLELANLSGADLSSATLLGTRLRGANLSSAILRYAQLAGADLQDANLEKADLSMADLRANFRDANLTGADLRGANLAGANLQYANLNYADLTTANLEGAKLLGAKLQGTKMDRSMEASARAVLTAPTMLQRKTEPRPARPALTVDFNKFGLGDAIKPAESGSRRASLPPPGGGSGDPLARWRNCLRVRFLGALAAMGWPLPPERKAWCSSFADPWATTTGKSSSALRAISISTATKSRSSIATFSPMPLGRRTWTTTACSKAPRRRCSIRPTAASSRA